MHLIFEDEDARVLRSVHDEPIPAVQDSAVAVAGVERHQRATPLDLRRKAREDIAIFEHRVVGDGIEVVVAIDRTGQPLHDDVEERVERRERSVLGTGHELAPRCRLSALHQSVYPAECLSQVDALRSGIVDSMVATRVGTILKITRTSPSWWNGYLSTPR